MMVTEPSHSPPVARPGHVGETGPQAMVGLGQQAVMQPLWSAGEALEEPQFEARGKERRAPSDAPGTTREAGGALGN